MVSDKVPPPPRPDWYKGTIEGNGCDANAKQGRLVLNFNMQDKPFMEIEGSITTADGIYMLEKAKKKILEDDDD